MTKLFSSTIIAFLILGIGNEVRAEVTRNQPAAAVNTVNVTNDPLKQLEGQGRFDIIQMSAPPAEWPEQTFGPTKLILVRFAKEFNSYLDILSELQVRGMMPANYRELLCYAAQAPAAYKGKFTVVAFGSSVEMPSGKISWQSYGVNNTGKRFLFYVVEGDGWPEEFLYLAKYQPPKPDNRPAKKTVVSAADWKKMQEITAIIKAEILKHKKNGTNPNKFVRRVEETTLTYHLIAIAAYDQPKTLAQANELAEVPEDFVLGKAMFEFNVIQGNETKLTIGCFIEHCRKRTVHIPLTMEGMGITDAPILIDIDYSTRLIPIPTQ